MCEIGDRDMNLRENLLNLFKNRELDESQFILGMDLGNSTSAICYYDVLRKLPEIIDISGGYGKANVPTALQYSPDTKEWIFGEYAVLNDGVTEDISFTNIINRLGNKTYIEIGDKLEPLAHVLSVFLKELIAGCRNINPKAEIAGIVISVPDYMSADAKDELVRAFAKIGYDKKIIDLVSQRECILAYHYHSRKFDKENMLILDYGGRELRGGIYSLSAESGANKADIISYYFDESLGANHIDEELAEKLKVIYANKLDLTMKGIGRTIEGQIRTLAYQHKDAIFQKHLGIKGMRLYYNFAYPPFYHIFTKEDAAQLITPYKSGLKAFLEKLFENNQSEGPRLIEYGDISTVLCTGGGFEMLWAREVVEDIFPDSNVFIYKNPKATGAFGAAVIAAGRLGVEQDKNIKVIDSLQVEDDIGIMAASSNGEKFYPIIQRGSFWWQNNKKVKLIVNEEIEDNISFELKRRSEEGSFESIGIVELNGLAARPKGVTQVELSLEYKDKNTLCAMVEDKGFGNFYMKTGAKNQVIFELA